MTHALKTLLKWAKNEFDLNNINVRVRSDNHSALLFYEKLGFKKMKSIPLNIKTTDNMTILFEDPELTNSEIQLVHMNLCKG